MNKRKAQDVDVHVRAIPEPRAGQRTRTLECVVWRPRGMALQGARPVGAFQGAWLSHPHLQFNTTVAFLGFTGLSEYFQYLLVDAYSRLQVRSPFQRVFGIECSVSVKVSAGRSHLFPPGAVTS